jgi:Raf kinase inhibitor-like YbhB/YbcL family protein
MVGRSKAAWVLAGLVGLGLATGACNGSLVLISAKGERAMLKLESKGFKAGDDIPSRFTCDGANVSPQLSWSAPPKGTQSLALVVDDPDAPVGTFVHWVLYDLPASARELPEGVPTTDNPAAGGRQGTNDFRRTGYAGPCPPPGKAHRYYFRLYALDRKLDLPAGTRRSELDQAMQGHILDQAELMGRYARH